MDEIQWRSGHTYLTLVYQITDVKRLLWVSHERTEQSLRKFFEALTDDVRTGIRFVCSDMWKPYLNVIAEQIPQAVHVLDRFHIMRNMNVAIDEVRAAAHARHPERFVRGLPQPLTPATEVWINPPQNRPHIRTLQLPRDSTLVPQVSQSH